MACVLILRLVLEKTERQPYHLLDTGFIWYDRTSTASGQDFFGYTIFNSDVEWFDYCFDRDLGQDRTRIALAPAGNTLVNTLKTRLETDLSSYSFTVELFDSRDDIMSTISASGYEQNGVPGICFGAALVESSTDNYQVNMIFDDVITERTDDPNMPNQELPVVDEYQRKPNFEAYEQYKLGGYAYLQNMIGNLLLRDSQGDNAYISMVYTPMKTSTYNDDDFAEAATNMWNFIILIIYIAPLYRLIYNVVLEKETKIREAMKIMGLIDFPYWFSWFSYYFIITSLQSIAMILVLIRVFEYSNLFLIWLYLWLFGMSLFGFGVFVSSFFSSAKTAAIVGTMLFYVSSFIFSVVEDRSVSETAKTLCSFFPTVAVQLAGVNLLEFEESGIGLTTDNVNSTYLNYKFATCYWMLVIAFFVFLTLGLYLENVLPAAVGVRKPLWFPFTKNFWCGSHQQPQDYYEDHNDDESHNTGKKSNKVASSDQSGEHSDGRAEVHESYFEEIPEYLRRKEDDNELIKISNLKKRFDNDFYAINGLYGEMYEDEIFALLGHNGAGKTTTINVLCGMLAASSGKASIYGYDVKNDMKELRKMMGICPQHNILFPKLSVKEHLSIFADFKGMDRKEIDDEIERLLKDLHLDHKANVLSKDLSGGYKRKLSLGIALVGGSKIVFLDEPSSGLDATSRREMWEMLKRYKSDRIIILTTHYMEEADNLGDRIGIMSNGQMLCCGTSDFLKNKFGEGYNLVVVKAERGTNEKLERFVLDNVPNAKKVSEVSSEATFLLPKETSEHFPEFFKKFDKNLADLGVNSYGVSMTTLEEVFLQVEGGSNEEKDQAIERIKKKMTSELGKEDENYSMAKEQIEGACNIFWLHFIALFLKRLILTKRNVKGFLTDLLVPSILIITGFGLSLIEFYEDSASRTLEPSLFPLPQRTIYNTDNISGGGDPATMIGLLEPSSAFDPSGTTVSGTTPEELLINFDNQLYQASVTDPLEPYRYGHYYFNQLDFGNHQYQVVTFANITSQESIVAFPHFMYEAILKNARGSNFQYTMVNDPMPVAQIYKDQEKGGNGLFTGFVLGIAFALIPTSIIGFILHERVNALVHQQIISGMNKVSYWFANFVFDVLKVFIPVIVAI